MQHGGIVDPPRNTAEETEAVYAKGGRERERERERETGLMCVSLFVYVGERVIKRTDREGRIVMKKRIHSPEQCCV